MTDHDDKPFDAAIRQQLHNDPEPDDAGFSLRVMGALPDHAPLRRRRWARLIQRAQWAATSLAACGIAALLSDVNGPLDMPHALAAAALMGLLIFWSVPSRWNRT